MSDVTFAQILWSIFAALVVGVIVWKASKNETMSAFLGLVTLVVGLIL